MASDSSTSKKDEKSAPPATELKPDQPAQKAAALEEDDEFEDFPVDSQYSRPRPPHLARLSKALPTASCSAVRQTLGKGLTFARLVG